MTYTIFWTKYAGQDKNPPKQDGAYRTESINTAYTTMQYHNIKYAPTWKGFVEELKENK